MATGIELIFCANGNRRFAQIAIDWGFLYGAQLPGTIYHPIYFADQDWKNPVLTRYADSVKEHRPHLASVLDLERAEQLNEVLEWSETIAPFVQEIMIIPKVFNIITKLPRAIGGRPIRLGYSVPTKYGGTEVPVWEFAGWPVHLLGGSPHAQMELRSYLDVVSADGNYAQKCAISWSSFWAPGTATFAKNRYWPRLEEADGFKWETDAMYEAFSRSCKNIMNAWNGIY